MLGVCLNGCMGVHAAYGAISSEEDSSGGDDGMLAGVDPFLNPVLDPFVAVRCHASMPLGG